MSLWCGSTLVAGRTPLPVLVFMAACAKRAEGRQHIGLPAESARRVLLRATVADLGYHGDEGAAGQVDEDEEGAPERARVDVEAEHAHGTLAREASEDERHCALHGVG
jgi:hypothetical protein